MAKAWHRSGDDPGVSGRGLATGLPAAGLPRQDGPPSGPSVRPLDWRKRMSDNIAYALLVYTALQIFVTMSALKADGASLLPYLALIILVGAIIPSCRRFEKRWNRLTEAQAANPEFSACFRRDRLLLWALAIGLPFAITAVFRVLAMITV